jgi:hypothetical protein
MASASTDTDSQIPARFLFLAKLRWGSSEAYSHAKPANPHFQGIYFIYPQSQMSSGHMAQLVKPLGLQN